MLFGTHFYVKIFLVISRLLLHVSQPTFPKQSVIPFGLYDNSSCNFITVKILKFGTPQTIAIIVLKIEKFDVTLH